AVNYRSSAALVDAYNHILTGDGPFFTGGVDYDQPVTAGASVRLEDASGRALTPVHLLRVRGAKGKQATALLAERIAGEVEELLAEPPRLVKGDERRALCARDVFVLSRSIREAEEVAAALRARGL